MICLKILLWNNDFTAKNGNLKMYGYGSFKLYKNGSLKLYNIIFTINQLFTIHNLLFTIYIVWAYYIIT